MYKNTAEQTDTLEAKFKRHCQQKQAARQIKEDAKKQAKDDRTFVAACFDLEKVLNCPHGDVSSFYYHRKLSLYNFFIFYFLFIVLIINSAVVTCWPVVWTVLLVCKFRTQLDLCVVDRSWIYIFYFGISITVLLHCRCSEISHFMEILRLYTNFQVSTLCDTVVRGMSQYSWWGLLPACSPVTRLFCGHYILFFVQH